MIKINLLAEGKRPAAVRKSKSPKRALLESEHLAGILLLVGLLVVGLLPSGAWWWLKRAEIADNKQEIADAERRVEELSAIIEEVEEYKAKQAELERKIQVIEDLRRNQRGPVQVMDSISRALPELLWLDNMQMNANTITLTGRAFSTNAVATFIENLDGVEEFDEPSLRGLQERGQVYNFNIAFAYSFTAPEEPPEDGVEPAVADTAEAAGGTAATDGAGG